MNAVSPRSNRNGSFGERQRCTRPSWLASAFVFEKSITFSTRSGSPAVPSSLRHGNLSGGSLAITLQQLFGLSSSC